MEPTLLLVTAAIFVSLISGIESTSFTIINNCPYTIWPGIQNNANVPDLGNSGFALNQGESNTIAAPSGWGGRFWARTFCTTDGSGRFTCTIGDCGTGQIPCNGNGGAPPVSLAEFTLNGNAGKDFYDVSLVDGFNVPVNIAPTGSGCASTGCSVDINASCPNELAVRDSSGTTIACKSACLAFGTDAYCCTGPNNSAATCGPSTYSTGFKNQCPQVYTYAYEDKSSLPTCPTGGDYTITFCLLSVTMWCV